MNRITPALLISLLGIYPHEARAMDAADPVAALVQGNNAFALDLYAQLSQGDGNRFISPFSISTALAMTYAGAQDETALQIAKALRFKLPPSQLHPAFHKLITELHGRNATQVAPDRPADVQLFTANALWTQAGERILRRLPEANRDQLPGGAVPGRLPPRPRGSAANDQRLGRRADQGQDQGPAQINAHRPANLARHHQRDLFQSALGQPVLEGEDVTRRFPRVAG